MNPLREMPLHGKISPEFSARLARSNPKAKVHAIVVLSCRESSRQPNQTHPTPDRLRAAIQQIRGGAMDALSEIDQILAPFDGRRLSGKPTALGTITVESNPAGIVALANSSRVKAILEDQPISQVL